MTGTARRLAREAVIIGIASTFFLLLAATVGLPGGADVPAEAAKTSWTRRNPYREFAHDFANR